MSDHDVGSRSQVKPTDHVVPTIRTPPGHRRRYAGNDQGQPARLHDELRCGDVAPTMPELADDHIGYGRQRVAVIVEPAHPSQIAPKLMAAHGLTEREQQLTRLVLQGFSTIDIAGHLVISVHTVQGT